MSRTKATILDACGKAVRTAFTLGKSEPSELESVGQGRLVLLGFIRDFASADNKQSLHLQRIVRAMHDLHPEVDYVSRVAIIRDLADICITLERIESGKRRSNEKKNLEATLACEYLKDEFMSD